MQILIIIGESDFPISNKGVETMKKTFLAVFAAAAICLGLSGCKTNDRNVAGNIGSNSGSPNMIPPSNGMVTDGNGIIGDLDDYVAEPQTNGTDNNGNPLSNAAKNAGDIAGNVTDNAGKIVSDIADGVGDTVSDIAENVGDTVSDITDHAGDAAENAADNIGDTIEGKHDEKSR